MVASKAVQIRINLRREGVRLRLHLIDAAGRPYLNPDVPWTPHEHNGVPCKYVTGHG